MAAPANPFTNRGAITKPEDFFGREEQIGEITTRLRTMQSSSVVGERRIGKSSLLYHLAYTGAQRLDDPSQRLFYMDLQDARYHTAVGFLQSTLRELGVSAEAIKPENTLNRNLIAWSEQIEALERSGQRLVLLLDEFENTFKHPEHFNEDFFDHLRSQINLGKLALVTASRQGLQTLSLEGRLTSPFYNVFTVVELKEFTEDEARAFLDAYRHRVGFTDTEIGFILSYVDVHPLKLRILCDWVIRNRERRLGDRALAEEIGREYGHFFPGPTARVKKVKRFWSLDFVNRWLDTLKKARDVFSGSKGK